MVVAVNVMIRNGRIMKEESNPILGSWKALQTYPGGAEVSCYRTLLLVYALHPIEYSVFKWTKRDSNLPKGCRFTCGSFMWGREKFLFASLKNCCQSVFDSTKLEG